MSVWCRVVQPRSSGHYVSVSPEPRVQQNAKKQGLLACARCSIIPRAAVMRCNLRVAMLLQYSQCFHVRNCIGTCNCCPLLRRGQSPSASTRAPAPGCDCPRRDSAVSPGVCNSLHSMQGNEWHCRGALMSTLIQNRCTAQ